MDGALYRNNHENVEQVIYLLISSNVKILKSVFFDRFLISKLGFFYLAARAACGLQPMHPGKLNDSGKFSKLREN